MKNEEVVQKIQEYHEGRIATLEDHVATLNKEMGTVQGVVEGLREVTENNNFWLKVVGVGTPGTVIILWLLERVMGG